MDIADSISQNDTILRLGVHFNTLGPRATVQEHLKKNWDQRKYFIEAFYSRKGVEIHRFLRHFT